MTISKKPYSMDIQCPYIMCEYLDYGKTVATIDFLVPNQHRRFFSLEILDNKQLQLKITVPGIFCDPARLMLQCGHKRNFHKKCQGNGLPKAMQGTQEERRRQDQATNC